MVALASLRNAFGFLPQKTPALDEEASVSSKDRDEEVSVELEQPHTAVPTSLELASLRDLVRLPSLVLRFVGLSETGQRKVADIARLHNVFRTLY